MPAEQSSFIWKRQNLLPDTVHQLVIISTREIRAPNAALKDNVPRKSDLLRSAMKDDMPR